MKRKLVFIACALSSLACAIFAVVWILSFLMVERLEYSYHGERCRLLVYFGKTRIDNEPEVRIQTEKDRQMREAMSSMPGFGFLVFVPRAGAIMNPPSHVPPRWSHASRIPLQAAAALLAILPVHAAWRVTVRRRRGNRGLCTACGYDLTENMSGVCPECGTAVPAKENF